MDILTLLFCLAYDLILGHVPMCVRGFRCFTAGVAEVMAHDPSRRLFLSGLPAEVTRRDIVEFVKKRTKANPMYIEIAKDEAGNGKGYAHATVEGLRAVVEALNGVPFPGSGARIVAAQAKPHFSVPIMKLKKEREDAEIAACDARIAAKEAKVEEEASRKKARDEFVKAMFEVPSDAEEDDERISELARFVRKAPRPEECPFPAVFAGSRMKYATIAAEIAEKCREKHREAQQYQQQQQAYRESGGYNQQQQQSGHHGGYASSPNEGPSNWAQHGGRGGGQQYNRGGFQGRGGGGFDQQRPAPAAVKFSDAAVPVAPPPAPAAPAEPSKEAKKLANLQAKLAALKQKLGK